MTFPCTKCGACCNRAHMIMPFPYGDRVNGGCIMLSKDRLCEVYDTRPWICRIERIREIFHRNEDVKEYYKREAEICNKWIKEDNLDDKYLIDLKQFEG